jgi:hypothetical protein
MTRIDTLERVLVAARAVLEARENQMLTRVEWDALAVAVEATRTENRPARKPSVQIVFEDGLMTVMDDRNQGYDCLDLENWSLEDANAQIDLWSGEYAFDVEAAQRDLAAYFAEL